MSPETVRALLGTEFRFGLLMGVVALAVGALVGFIWKWRRDAPVPLAGPLLAGATLAGLSVVLELPSALWVGLLCLAAAGAVHRWVLRGSLISWLIALPGAWLVAQGTTVPADGWVPWFSLVAITVGAPLVATSDRYLERVALTPTLFCLSVIGVFFAVPDTEHALVLLGATLPLALLGWPSRLASLGSVGSFVLMGMLAWVVVQGGYGRPGSIIGGTLCLGLLVVIPPVRFLTGKTRGSSPHRLVGSGFLLLVAAHLGVVAVASRLVAVPVSPVQAGIVGSALLMVAGLLWGWIQHSVLNPERLAIRDAG